ncbi:MAG: ExeM/NucH family extracellular endonuclease [Actinomycetia bacterium]|nr:ExeM/NucH family extracellular endonuclease [Actinomycetes bacterium]
MNSMRRTLILTFALVVSMVPLVGASASSDGPPADITLIHDIQGSGDVSPIVGERVTIEGIVVADEETFDSLAGFFVQEEDEDVDADPMTSEGIFVFNFSSDTVDIGDLVRVTGDVQERFENTQLSNFAVVEVLAKGQDLPTPASITFPLGSVSDLEWYEGMVVEFTQSLAITEFFNFDRFGEIVVGLPTPGTNRQMNPTSVYAPGTTEAAALATFNSLSRISIDDGISSQNPERIVHPIFRDGFTQDNSFRGGDIVEGLQGAIYHTFGEHKLYPNDYSDYEATEREDPPDVDGDIEVGTLNALNFFVTIDANGNKCGPTLSSGCRGADNPDEFQRQRAKLLSALEELDADIVGLVEVENSLGVEPLADIVAGLNELEGEDTYAYIDAGLTGGDVIKNGIIYKPEEVTPVGDIAILDTPDFIDPNNTGSDRNRAALAVSFVENDSGEEFSIVVNHLKSKGSRCGSGDDHPEAGSCNLTRTLAAGALLDWLDTNPTGSDDPDWLIIGDLNSYDKEAPVDVLRAGGYSDLIAEYEGEFAYSFVFSGIWGYLDYAMSSATMTDQVTEAAMWHLNADEPDIFDYDTTFKSDTAIALYEPDEFRSSDHDAVLVGLDLDSDDDDDKDDDDKDDDDDDKDDDH